LQAFLFPSPEFSIVLGLTPSRRPDFNFLISLPRPGAQLHASRFPRLYEASKTSSRSLRPLKAHLLFYLPQLERCYA